MPITVCNPDGFGTPTIVDSDSDGIPDETDAYPFDPDRAFNSYFPEEGSYATVAFEDLWPAQGDYDFNDLVVAVYGTEVTNADDGLVDIYINFIVKAVGASLNNGFGFQLGTIAPGMIASVTGMVLNRGYVTLSANGTEAGQQKTVVIVTESIEDVIHRAGGSMFNTVENGNVGTSDTTEIVIMFDEPIDRNLFGPEAFNPFLIKSQNRSVEIHLTDNPPTDLMDMELFGTLDDDSNPATGRYYVTANNLPWGLLILEPFDYPIEKSPIISAYNYFAEWAETGGSTYEDWYHNQPGYRNTVDIYTP
nr:LruC domain-containing protein [Bacteroidota bacterium]